MRRRSFFRRLAAAAIGVALIRELPGIAPVPESITQEPLGVAIRMMPMNRADVDAYLLWYYGPDRAGKNWAHLT